MYIEIWGEASTSDVLASCPERQDSFLHSRVARHTAVLKQRHPVNLARLDEGLGTGERGHFLRSPPTVCLVTKPVSSCCFWIHHSPWWTAWWGWWERRHCGPGCCNVPSPASARPSVWCWPNPGTRSVFPTTHQSRLYSGHMQEVTPWYSLYWMTIPMLSIKQRYARCFPDKWNVSASFCVLVRPSFPWAQWVWVYFLSLFAFQHSGICD